MLPLGVSWNLAKWKDKQRIAKAGLQTRVCIVCGKTVMGCSADDKCPATLLCMLHYQVQGFAYGDMQSFGLLDPALLDDESLSEGERAQIAAVQDATLAPIREGLKDWPRWKQMFEAAMKRRGLVHGWVS